MRADWPDWARRAWTSIPERRRRAARLVWRRLAHAFDGVLVGPQALACRLVDEGRLGYRTTLETLGLLEARDLLASRPAAEGTVLWVPDELMPDPGPHADGSRGPRLPGAPRVNGTPTRAGVEA